MPRRSTSESVPQVMQARYDEIVACEDALAIYHDVVARGTEVDESFVGNAMGVVGIRDPDGYALFFESPTDVPEETLPSAWSDR